MDARKNRLAMSLVAGASLLAVFGAVLIGVVPSVRMEQPGGDVRTIGALEALGPMFIAVASIPAAASLAALVLVRWRVPRAVAAGVLWFFTIGLYVFWPFYLPAALVQTASIFPRYRRQQPVEQPTPQSR